MNSIPDANARQKALDPRRSFIVQAPAGSGKTELLIRRFLRLLGGVQHPEQILAITFTRKAAGEMKARILEALQNAQEGTPPGPDHERDTWALAQKALDRDRHRGWRLLENPARLKVQTIDSFCAGLTRHLPILSRMGGPLSLLENPRPLFWQAASRILARAEADDPIGEAVRTILRHLDNDKSSFLTRIVQLLEKRDQWLIPFFEQFRVPEEARGPLEQTFARLIESILQEADPLIPDELRSPLVSSAAWAGTQLKETQSDHDLVCLKDLERFPEPRIAHLALWKGIARLLLTQTGDYRKPRGINKKLGFPTGPADSPPQTRKQEFLELLETLTPKEELRRILHKIQSLPEPRLSDEEWIVLKATLCLLPEVEQVLRAVFTEQVQTDFTEIALAALNALGTEDEPTDLLLYLDHQIQHILVDEYQDTSYKQRDLLKRLTSGWQPGDGRTLFLVGDPMQSIYRFRDAEVGLFLKTQREGIHEVSLTPLSLTTNFRSQSKIVDWVNTCFQDLFPRQGNEDLGAISYSASRAFRPPNSGDGVVLHPVPHNGNLAETGLQEAREIICLIRTLQEVHPDSSIALLVRARGHLSRLVRLLHQENIPFRAEEIDPLTHRSATLDLLALLRALLSPLDRVAWLSLLRAPWCGLSLSDLHALCERNPDLPLWDLMRNETRLNRLSAEGQKRVKRLTLVMEKTLRAKPSANFRDLLEGCWIALGGPACVNETTLQDVEVFFDEVEKIVESGDLARLQNIRQVLEELYANPSVKEENVVHIMTMHKAKGLEFDHVILPGLGRRLRPEGKRLVFWMPHGDDLLIAPIEEEGGPDSQVYNFLRNLDREKDRFETQRLLYVAATRAREQLHLFGHLRDNGKDEPRPEKNSLLDKLWPVVEPSWNPPRKETRTPAPVSPSAERETEPPHRIRRLPADFEPPPPPPALDTGIRPRIEEEEPRDPEFAWVSNRDRTLGTVLHLCFKEMAEQGLEHWNDERLARLGPQLKSALLGEGLPVREVEDSVQTGLETLRNFLNDETGRWIIAPHAEAQSEYPLTGYLEGRYKNRFLDRTFVDQGVRWIIDFKTGTPSRETGSGPDLEQFFAQEKEKYAPQLKEYEELLRLGDENRPIRKALYYPYYRRLIEL